MRQVKPSAKWSNGLIGCPEAEGLENSAQGFEPGKVRRDALLTTKEPSQRARSFRRWHNRWAILTRIDLVKSVKCLHSPVPEARVPPDFYQLHGFLFMNTQIPENYYQILARERSHEEARQTVAINRMLVQSLVIINGVATIVVLAYCAVRSPSGGARVAEVLSVVLYCLGVFSAIFAGLYVRRTAQEWSSFWELSCYLEKPERDNLMERHRQQAIKSKRWSTGLLVSSEIVFLAASLSLAISLG
jgi:hypothetical protein